MQQRLSRPNLGIDDRDELLRDVLLDGPTWELPSGAAVDAFVSAVTPTKKKAVYQKEAGDEEG